MILPPIYHCEKRVRCGEDSGDRFDSEDVRCVLEVTQTHIHIHTHTFTPLCVDHGELPRHSLTGGGGNKAGGEHICTF